jgi:hypothetical protein
MSDVAWANAGTGECAGGSRLVYLQRGRAADVTCLAQTNDGFLWLDGLNRLFRFDGTRFEPFSSPFGDRLLLTNLYFLFAPPSGGLWIGFATWGLTALFLRKSKTQASDRLVLESDFEGAVRAWGRRQHERPGRTCPDRQTVRQCATFRFQDSGYCGAPPCHTKTGSAGSFRITTWDATRKVTAVR